MVKYAKTITSILVISLFLFLRFYNLSNSFFFYNDMGRDMLVLQQWQEKGTPPLLGPQTSALPFNQSPIYFYLLYPGFLISHGNPISLVYTLAFVYLVVLIFSLTLPVSRFWLVVSYFLISIHPQYIAQGRYVWNPSFVSPFIILSVIAFYLLIQKFSWKLSWIFSLSLALAVSLSYSVAPLLIAVAIYWLLFNRKNFVALVISISSSFVLFNLPLLFFELRHHFLLTTALLTKKSPPQDFIGFSDKLYKLSSYIFATQNQTLDVILFVGFFGISLYIIFRNYRQPKSLQFLTSFLLAALFLITFATPVSPQAHYIFGFTCLIFILISTLNRYLLTLSLIFFSIIYLNPSRLNSYFKTAPRTLTEMNQCFKRYCDTLKSPTYVSVNSSYHPFHNGPEHRYLLKLAGCDVKDIETQNGQANIMTVVLDNSQFTPQTKFYELDQFGKVAKTTEFKCQDNFSLITLTK